MNDRANEVDGVAFMRKDQAALVIYRSATLKISGEAFRIYRWRATHVSTINQSIETHGGYSTTPNRAKSKK